MQVFENVQTRDSLVNFFPHSIHALSSGQGHKCGYNLGQALWLAPTYLNRLDDCLVEKISLNQHKLSGRSTLLGGILVGPVDEPDLASWSTSMVFLIKLAEPGYSSQAI